VRVQVLDGVLDSDDVLVPLGVDLVDHRRQGGGLARAGRAGDQDQPARFVAQLFEHRRQPQVGDGGDLEGNRAEHAADRPRCWNRLARNRDRLRTPNEKSSS